MKDLKSVLEASILANIDDQLESGDKHVKDNIKKWIEENYSLFGGRFKISDNPNENGLYEVTVASAEVTNKNIISLTNGTFEWKKIPASFICSNCSKLTSLEGAPKEVGGNFDCSYCTSLESLKGAPEKIGADFKCYGCGEQFTENDVKKVSKVKGKIQTRWVYK